MSARPRGQSLWLRTRRSLRTSWHLIWFAAVLFFGLVWATYGYGDAELSLRPFALASGFVGMLLVWLVGVLLASPLSTQLTQVPRLAYAWAWAAIALLEIAVLLAVSIDRGSGLASVLSAVAMPAFVLAVVCPFLRYPYPFWLGAAYVMSAWSPSPALLFWPIAIITLPIAVFGAIKDAGWRQRLRRSAWSALILLCCVSIAVSTFAIVTARSTQKQVVRDRERASEVAMRLHEQWVSEYPSLDRLHSQLGLVSRDLATWATAADVDLYLVGIDPGSVMGERRVLAAASPSGVRSVDSLPAVESRAALSPDAPGVAVDPSGDLVLVASVGPMGSTRVSSSFLEWIDGPNAVFETFAIGARSGILILAAALLVTFGAVDAVRYQLGLVARLSAAEERERVARDAHDRIYNRLAALAKNIEASATEVGSSAHELNAAANDIRGAVGDLQRILKDEDKLQSLEPVDGMSPRGTVPTLISDVCAAQAARYGMEVQCSGLEHLETVGPTHAWDLECLVEEALTNAAKHGSARHVVVTFARDHGALLIEVADDGSGIPAGFDVDNVDASSHGLTGMRRRALKYDGSISLAGSQTGATLRIQLAI